MRVPVLVLLAAALVLGSGCASKRKAAYNPERSGLDYYSANKSSVKFLLDTFRFDRGLRRQNKVRMWGKGEKRREAAAVQRESLKFLWDALKAGEAESWKHTWTEQFPEMLKGPDNFVESVRFGLLDSGR